MSVARQARRNHRSRYARGLKMGREALRREGLRTSTSKAANSYDTAPLAPERGLSFRSNTASGLYAQADIDKAVQPASPLRPLVQDDQAPLTSAGGLPLEAAAQQLTALGYAYDSSSPNGGVHFYVLPSDPTRAAAITLKHDRRTVRRIVLYDPTTRQGE